MRLPEFLLRLRNRLLSNPGFQRWAASFPLTRWRARRRARELFDIVAGFVYSQILYACVQVRLFEVLGEGTQSLEELAPRLNLPPEGARRLLRAAASLRLVDTRGQDRYSLGELGTAMLANPAIAAMVEHHALAYADLRDPVALLRGELDERALQGYWAYVGHEEPTRVDPRAVSGYSRLMADSQCLIADDILDAYPLERHRCLLDLAGGEGAFLSRVAQRWPHLRLILFDLPAVAERAQARFAHEGISARAQAIGGDVRRDPLPRVADLVSLVRVLHDHDDQTAVDFARAAYESLTPGGCLLVAEPMSGTPGAEPVGDAYFGFYLLAMGSGRPRTPGEIAALLKQVGFKRVRRIPTRRPILTQLLVAQRD
ncbi:methyltransferase domain-containing protein [Caldichromatium japonicum]|uniref:Methyltransferase domain-containing protein n=1 Tax=Caldichromatium japonicum TaxID=2699430 RepID=A0A6G7VH90_9GAMM|nr:methyltransferase domain-containing protein [Caldichromatium japonicum]